MTLPTGANTAPSCDDSSVCVSNSCSCGGLTSAGSVASGMDNQGAAFALTDGLGGRVSHWPLRQSHRVTPTSATAIAGGAHGQA